jgi:hypothetical protein
MRNASDKSYTENQNTHLMFNNASLFSQIVQFACRIPKATDIHLVYVILITFQWLQRLRERAAILRYM